MNNGEKNNKKSLKGFYIALVSCIVALIVAIIVGVSDTISKLNQTPQFAKNDDAQEQIQDVNKNENSVELEKEQQTPAKEEKKEQVVVPPASEVEQQKPVVEQNNEEELPVAATVSFAKPLEGEILNKFSGGELVKSKTLNEWRTHDGIDIKAAADTPVKSACNGIIEEVTEDPLWGTCITISHNGNYQTFYKGLAPNIDVKKGQKINLGDVIGYVGNTAEIEIAEESHLHFAVKQNGEWLDPEVLF